MFHVCVEIDRERERGKIFELLHNMVPFGFGLGVNYEAISSKYPFGMRLPRVSLLSIRDQCY